MMKSGWSMGFIPDLQKPRHWKEGGTLTLFPGPWMDTAADAGESITLRLT